LVIAFRGLQKKSLIGFGAIIILCDVALFVNLLYPYTGILGERVLFGSALGIALMLVGALSKVQQNEASTLHNLLSSSKVISAVFLLILGVGGWLTVNRNSDWKDRLTLFTVDATNCAKSVKLQQLYAHHLRQEYLDNPETFTTAQANQVLRAYQKGINLYDDWPITHYGAGNVLFFDLGNAQRAVPYYLKAVELNPKYADAQYDLLNAYLELGDFENAEKVMNVLIGMFPEDESLFDRVLKALFSEVQFDQAERINQQFLEAFPKLDLPYIYQGNVNIAKGDTLGALLHFEQALEFNPNYADLEGYLKHLKQELNK
jgi:Flp pilus assembly protein TadD